MRQPQPLTALDVKDAKQSAASRSGQHFDEVGVVLTDDHLGLIDAVLLVERGRRHERGLIKVASRRLTTKVMQRLFGSEAARVQFTGTVGDYGIAGEDRFEEF